MGVILMSSLIEDNKALISKICKVFYTSMVHERPEANLMNGGYKESLALRVVSENSIKVIEYKNKVYIGLDINKCALAYSSGGNKSFNKENQIFVLYSVTKGPVSDTAEGKNFIPCFRLNFDTRITDHYDYDYHKDIFKTTRVRNLNDLMSYDSFCVMSGGLVYSARYVIKNKGD
jgi:hypothetical protein